MKIAAEIIIPEGLKIRRLKTADEYVASVTPPPEPNIMEDIAYISLIVVGSIIGAYIAYRILRIIHKALLLLEKYLDKKLK